MLEIFSDTAIHADFLNIYNLLRGKIVINFLKNGEEFKAFVNKPYLSLSTHKKEELSCCTTPSHYLNIVDTGFFSTTYLNVIQMHIGGLYIHGTLYINEWRWWKKVHLIIHQSKGHLASWLLGCVELHHSQENSRRRCEKKG